MLMHAIAQGVYKIARESALKADSGRKNPLPHQGIEPASAACRSGALPTELHPNLFRFLQVIQTAAYSPHRQCRRVQTPIPATVAGARPVTGETRHR